MNPMSRADIDAKFDSASEGVSSDPTSATASAPRMVELGDADDISEPDVIGDGHLQK